MSFCRATPCECWSKFDPGAVWNLPQAYVAPVMWMNFRDEDFVRNKTVYIALGILPDRNKEMLGIRFEHTEGVRHNAEIFSFNVIVMDA